MAQIEETDLVYKGPWVRSAQQRYLSGFSKVIRFHSKGYSVSEIRELTDMSERLIKDYLGLLFNVCHSCCQAGRIILT
jgi:hypothetical protein